MAHKHQRRIAFAGTGNTEFARFIPDKSREQLLLEAALKAIENAGLEKNDVDGIVMTLATDAYMMAEHLGITPKVAVTNENGCGSAGFALDVAEWALATGECNYVLMACGGKESLTGRSSIGSNFHSSWFTGEIRPHFHQMDMDLLYGSNWLPQFAMVGQRHMYEFGTTLEQLASVSVAYRYNASLNPEAVYRTPITVEDVLSSPIIASPLTKLMCAMVNDGACAAIVTTAERARDLKQPPVYVLGTGSGFAGYTLSKATNGDMLGRFDMVRSIGKYAADTAYARAGVTADDIDVANADEHFAPIGLTMVEDYGFCAKGEGGPFVGENHGANIKVGGKIPFTTYGGEMSGTHAGNAHPPMLETIRQLHGRLPDACPDWQNGVHLHDANCRHVKDASIGLFSAVSGKGTTHSMAVLTTDA